MTKLSVAIATYNEEKNIERCLKSVSFADEIVVVDESSIDKTAEIAKMLGAKVFKVKKEENFHNTKQTAIEKCTSDWILVMDADEEVSKELKSEIQATIESNTDFSGFEIPRRNKIFGKWFGHTGFYPDYQVRLFKKGKGKQPGKSFHEMIEVSGDRGKLTNDLLHYHYTSIDQFVTRLNRYTTNDANYLLSKGEKVVWSDSIKFPTDEFLKRFFFWEGYKDGLHGLMLSLLQALSRAVVFAKMWEAQGFFEYQGSDFLGDVKMEGQKVKADLDHYLIQTTKNPAKKLSLKLKRKLNI